MYTNYTHNEINQSVDIFNLNSYPIYALDISFVCKSAVLRNFILSPTENNLPKFGILIENEHLFPLFSGEVGTSPINPIIITRDLNSAKFKFVSPSSGAAVAAFVGASLPDIYWEVGVNIIPKMGENLDIENGDKLNIKLVNIDYSGDINRDFNFLAKTIETRYGENLYGEFDFGGKIKEKAEDLISIEVKNSKYKHKDLLYLYENFNDGDVDSGIKY